MPVRRLPPNSNLNHLRYQAKDLLKAHAMRDMGAAQRLREFHPRFHQVSDDAILAVPLKLSDAQLTVARESGFPSWSRLKRHIESPTLGDRLDLPHHERIEDSVFRRAVELLDRGDPEGLRKHLKLHPRLATQRIVFEGGNYFRNPALLEFVAENPVRRGKLPQNIVEVAAAIVDAGVTQTALNETLMLVATGSVARQSGQQIPLINFLCDAGANAGSALQEAALHGEMGSVDALLARGAAIDLLVAATLGLKQDAQKLLNKASAEERQLALSQAASLGHIEIVRLLLDAGENPDRYNLRGHSHTTPLHQAAGAGHYDVVRLLVERGARLDMKDILWQGTPADWAEFGGQRAIASYLKALMQAKT